MRVACLLVVVYVALTPGCWTGSDVPATEVSRAPESRREATSLRLQVKLERTHCMGTCPVYKVVIYGDGRVDWLGIEHVAAPGPREGRVTRRELEDLSRQLDQVRFFERNKSGEIEKPPACTKVGTSTTCSFSGSISICSDTSHTIISVTRRDQSHRIDNAHCDHHPELEALEEFIKGIANLEPWIGS